MATAPTGIFPLNTVLYPGGWLPLQIFERRYVDLVSACLKEQRGFVVATLAAGGEVGVDQSFELIGTRAVIRDWDQGAGGLLNILTQGEVRCRIDSYTSSASGLFIGDIAEIADPVAALEPRFEYLAAGLEQVFAAHAQFSPPKPWLLDDANWVAYRWAERLPLPLRIRCEILRLDAADRKLELIAGHLHALQSMGNRSTSH